MSWMDSWSRPSANSKIPAPLYLLDDDVPYCHTCGRVMSSKKKPKAPSSSITPSKKAGSSNNNNNVVKYCSNRCRTRKAKPVDRQIERAIAALLDAAPASGLEKTAAKSRVVKGDHRVVVTCDEIEEVFFGSRFDPEKVYGRRKNRRHRAIGGADGGEGKEWKSVDMVSDPEGSNTGTETGEEEDDDDVLSMDGSTFDEDEPLPQGGGIRIRPPQHEAEVNFSVGGERNKAEKIAESDADRDKRLQGARRAEEREMVRRAARRLIVFGIDVPKAETRVDSPQKSRKSARSNNGKGRESASTDDEAEVEKKKAEALMNGVVVEPSFAKGNWSIRWRE